MLELHEFLTMLVRISFFRANPQYGMRKGDERKRLKNVGANEASAHKFGDEVPLPGCLRELLDKHVLKNAKKDSLAGVKTEIETSAEIQEVFKKYNKQLRKEWKGINGGSGPMKVEGKEVISQEMFCSDMGQAGKADSDKGSRRIVRELTVTHTRVRSHTCSSTSHHAYHKQGKNCIAIWL